MPTPAWALELAAYSTGDEALPADLGGINVVLNRARLASFLEEFAEDKDVRDLLLLDLLMNAAGFSISSTGLAESQASLPIRPFRLWEYTWLYKALRLPSGGIRVLDLGGPATPLSILAAVAGCRVTSLDINDEVVKSAQECARSCKLGGFEARVGDMRDLSSLPAAGFDAIISCSVLEHLTAQDQEVALSEMARVLAPGGTIGLTFDYGQPAPGANRYLPPPHDPPETAAEVTRRYCKGGLIPVGNAFAEDAVPGILFQDTEVRYTMASLFLAKPPAPATSRPRCELTGSALGNLVIERLPVRLFKTAGAGLAELRVEFDLAIQKQLARSALLEQAAVERLAAMKEKDAVIEEQRARAVILEAAAAERLALIEGGRGRA